MKKFLLSALRQIGYNLSRIEPSSDAEAYKLLYPADSISNKRFLNIGAGEFCHPCWTCIDRAPQWYSSNGKGMGKFVQYDLFSYSPLPFETGTIELAYMSHTIGHVDDTAVRNIMSELHRVLKPGGRLRVVTEDMDLFYRAWKENDRDFFFWKDWESLNLDYEKYGLKLPISKASITQLFLEEFAASASEIAAEGGQERISDDKFKELFSTLPIDQAYNYCTTRCPKEFQPKYPFRHMNWFNEAKVTKVMKDAGFDEIYRSAFQQSRAHVLRNGSYFDKTVPQLSLFMEARKS